MTTACAGCRSVPGPARGSRQDFGVHLADIADAVAEVPVVDRDLERRKVRVPSATNADRTRSWKVVTPAEQ